MLRNIVGRRVAASPVRRFGAAMAAGVGLLGAALGANAAMSQYIAPGGGQRVPGGVAAAAPFWLWFGAGMAAAALAFVSIGVAFRELEDVDAAENAADAGGTADGATMTAREGGTADWDRWVVVALVAVAIEGYALAGTVAAYGNGVPVPVPALGAEIWIALMWAAAFVGVFAMQRSMDSSDDGPNHDWERAHEFGGGIFRCRKCGVRATKETLQAADVDTEAVA